VATELVIAVPALLLMVLVILQFTVYAHARHIAQAIAAQALATARVDGGTPTAAQTAGQQMAAQLGPTLAHTSVDVQRGADRARVTVSGTAPAVLPGLALPVTVRDEGPIERVVAGTGG
jgi:Flp pilus assembly protein TadG